MFGKRNYSFMDSIADKNSLNYKVFTSKRQLLDEILAKREEDLISKEIEEEIYKQIEDQVADLLKKGLKL